MRIRETKDIDRAAQIACIKAFQRGNVTALDPVVRSHEKLIRATALRVKKTSPKADIEELKSAGLIGLCDAAACSGCDREIRFSTFAVHYLCCEKISLVRNDAAIILFVMFSLSVAVFFNSGIVPASRASARAAC